MVATVLAHLVFKNADGSWTWAAYWLLIVGAVMVVTGVANIANKMPRRWLPRTFPRPAQVALGLLGGLVGAGFISWTLVAAPGVLY